MRRRVFENAGEDAGGSLYSKCPGDGCMIWESAAGDYDYKVETDVCGGCKECGGCPPDPPSVDSKADEPDPEDLEDIVDDIADMIAWEDAGFETDWSLYDFGIKQLVQYWRQAERDIENKRALRIQIFLKSWMEK